MTMQTLIMKNQIFSLITKYALILAGLYFLENVFSFMLNEFKSSFELVEFARWRPIIKTSLTILLNIVVALFLSQDIKEHKVKTKYVLVTTILFRPVGVFVFLLFVLHQDRFVKPVDARTDD